MTPPDWETIEKAYRAGLLSVNQIAKNHEITEGAIRKRAKRDGWERDLTARVQEAVRTKAVREAVRKEAAHQPETEQEIIDQYAEIGSAALALHRRDIDLLRKRRERLMEHWDRIVGTNTTDPNAESEQHDLRTIDGATSILESVSRIDERIVKLERQALNLDTKNDGRVSLEDAIEQLLQAE